MRQNIPSKNGLLDEVAIVPITYTVTKDEVAITEIFSKSKCFTGLEDTRKSSEGYCILLTNSAQTFNAEREVDSIIVTFITDNHNMIMKKQTTKENLPQLLIVTFQPMLQFFYKTIPDTMIPIL